MLQKQQAWKKPIWTAYVDGSHDMAIDAVAAYLLVTRQWLRTGKVDMGIESIDASGLNKKQIKAIKKIIDLMQ